MALFEVCSIRDVKTEIFSQPFFFVSKGAALRAFFDEAVRPDGQIAKHPEDYAMFHVGVFDDSTGALVSLPQPEKIALAIEAHPKS